MSPLACLPTETLDTLDEFRAADRRRHARSAIAAKPEQIVLRMLDAANSLEEGMSPVLIALALRNLAADIEAGSKR